MASDLAKDPAIGLLRDFLGNGRSRLARRRGRQHDVALDNAPGAGSYEGAASIEQAVNVTVSEKGLHVLVTQLGN